MKDKITAHIGFRILFLGLFILMFSACTVDRDFKIDRYFSLVDLLISEPDMPSGWSVEHPNPANKDANFHAKEGVAIIFLANTEVRKASAHDVYRYKDEKQASKYFERYFFRSVIGSGEFIPQEWNPPNISTDEQTMKCKWARVYTESEQYLLCEWAGRYEEYIVSFQAWILPEMMTMDEMGFIVDKIDSIMVKHFND